MKTIGVTIELKIHKREPDVATWQRLMDVMGELDTAGMSSEEEDEIEDGGVPTKMYKVKVCEWRAPEIADYLRIIDSQTRKYDKQQPGTRRSLRVWVEEEPTSRAPKGLPRCMYNDEWLKKLSPLDYEVLQVSEKPFALFVAATDRMV